MTQPQCMSLPWLCMNSTGILNTFLSWDFFVPLGRLTYANYLLHMVVIAIFYYTTFVQTYATDYFCVSARIARNESKPTEFL